MARVRSRTVIVSVIVAAAVIVMAAVSVPNLVQIVRSGPGAVTDSDEASKRPPALAAHLERLRQALPGTEGMSEDPTSADAERFMNRAYPDTDIPLERILAARAAFMAIQAKGASRDPGAPGKWTLLGPQSARYQATPYRSTYVPGEVSVSGRVTAMAIASTCTPVQCRIYVAAAGGGLWRTDNALAGNPSWTFLTGSIGINAIGSIALDPTDPTGATVWIGTGESNASGDSAAGVGIYKSTDSGATWNQPALGSSVFNGRSVGSIAIDPRNSNVIYAASTRGVRGVSSTTGGAVSLIPGAAPWGLYKSTDGGTTFTFIHNGSADATACFPMIGAACSVRGVRRVALDPSNPDIVYAGSYGRGVWRSLDGGATWTQIKASLNANDSAMRPEIAVNALPDGKTRMYVGEGSSGNPTARLFRTDDAAGAPAFVNMTSTDPASPGYGSNDYCTGQCWYDNLVVTPAGYPDIVYVGGSYQYGGNAYRSSNGRALVLSTDGGQSWHDMTKDATSRYFPNGLHPDHHALVVHPDNPYLFFNGSDGGVVRSSGSFSDESARCDDRGLADPLLSRCRQLLSQVPTRLESMNDGLSTLQFQSVSVDPTNPGNLLGGTQDNGTFITNGSDIIWRQTMWGDGGQSGFDTLLKTFRLHTYYSATPEVNFNNGRITDWHWVGDPLLTEPQAFYIPIVTDPKVSRWMWAGLAHVWRTKTHGAGAMSAQDFSRQCNSFTGAFTTFCGDWEPLGATAYAPLPFPNLPNASTYASTRLTYGPCGTSDGQPVCPGPYMYGETKAGGTVSRVVRAPSDSRTLWAATSAGRVFISKNADAEPAPTVAFERLDENATGVTVNAPTLLPTRFVSGIAVDPANPNRAFVVYSGYNATAATRPGHVFEVVYDGPTDSVTWSSLDNDLGDLPLTDVAYDPVTGDLFAANDFGVLRLASRSASWVVAGAGMPLVEVPSISIVARSRRLFAGTHGLGAWSLPLK